MGSDISRKNFLRLVTGSILSNKSHQAQSRTGPMQNQIQDKGIVLRAIPSSGEKIPAVGMGTWLTFDVGNSETKRKTLKEVLNIFHGNGGKLIDSSPMYGSSENVAGDLVSELKIRNNIFFATKVWTSGEDNGIRQMRESFEKMKVQHMDLMQVHNLVDAKTHLKTLRKWKAEGKIRYMGITHYLVSEYKELIQLMKSEKPDFVQFNYNMRVRDAEQQLLPFCHDNGIAVINNRPFDGGNLFERIRGRNLPVWARDWGIENWAQYFLKYIISHPAVTCAIPATSKPEHMKENIGAVYGPLPDTITRKKMTDHFDKL